jgi:hypothetical protein
MGSADVFTFDGWCSTLELGALAGGLTLLTDNSTAKSWEQIWLFGSITHGTFSA